MSAADAPTKSVPDESGSALRRGIALLEGPQTIGRGPGFWILIGLGIPAAALYPLFADAWTIGNAAYFMVWTFMAMGLSVVWGYAGALSFGQTAFSVSPDMPMAF